MFDIEGNIIYNNPLFQKKFNKEIEKNPHNFFGIFSNEISQSLKVSLNQLSEDDLVEAKSALNNKSIFWEISLHDESSETSKKFFTAVGTFTEEKKNENQEKNSFQEQFELAIKGSNDGIWDWDLVNNSLYVSPQWKMMLGYEDHELENKFETFTSLLYKDDFERVFAFVDEYLKGSIEHYDIDFRMYHKNGGYRWINAKGAALRDASGKPYRMAGSHTDITQRKNDEAQLSTAYQLLEQAGKIAKVGVWEVDLKSGKTSWTKATYDIFDYPETDSPDLHRNFDFYKEIGCRELVYNAVNELIANKKTFDLEFEIISNKGIQKWVRAIGNINDANPDDVKIYGTIQDITSAKNIVFELQEKQNLQNTIIGTNLGTWEWNLQTNETKYSNNWLQILGYSAHQLMPFTFQTCIDLIHHDEKAAVEEKYQLHLSGKTPFLEVEYRIQHANNQFIWVLDKGKVLAKDENGKPLKMFGAIQDISERKKEEEQKFLLENLINFSSDAIQVSDEEGKLIYINDTASQRLGIEKSNANNVYVYQFENTINSVEKWQAHVNELKQKNSLVVFGENTNAVTKESFPVEVTVRYLKIKEKGYVLAISRDITERIKAQSEIIKTKEKLEETGRTAQVGAFEIDVVNNRLIYSEVFKEMMHLPKDYVSTLDEGFQFLLPGEDFEKAKQLIFNCIVQGIPFDEEFRFLNLKNETIWVRIICKPEFKLGKVISVFGIFQNINYLKNAEEKIRDYANRISAILESTNDNVFALDAEFKYTAFNHIHKKLIFDRFKMDVYVGMSFFSIPFSQEEKLWIQNDISHALSGKQFSLIREYFNAEQNKTLYLEINFNPIFNDRKDVVGAAIFSKDISLQKQAELETKNLYDLTQLLIEISTSYINVDLRDLEPVVNHSLAMLGTFIGADRCYIFNYDWEKQICINTYEWCAQGITQQIENLQSVPIEVLNGWDVDHKANKAVYIADVDALETGSDLKEILSSQHIKSIVTIPIIDKEYCLGFVGFDYVKSKHVISEKEKILLFVYAQMYINLLKRQKFEKRLLFQEEKYRNIIANMNLGLLEVDIHENIVFANQSFCEMSGYALEYLIGKNAQKIFSNLKMQFHNDQVQERRKFGKSDIYELEVKIANNAKRWWLISGGPQYNDNKELIGSLGIHLDITEQKRLQGEQQLLLNLTQTQNERLRNFAYIVSHNLRSHTVNIQSLLEILIETQPDLKSLEMTGLLMQVADNLLETIHHLSDVALMNTDDAKDTTTINLYERTQRAIENVSAMAMHHQVEIINNLNGNEQIKGVPAYIDSIVLNFLTNGIRYRATDRKPFVKITSEMDGKYLILKISDNGLGIDLKRHGSKIFGMYKTFHKNPESRGVGLFMTKNQVEAMGGKIEVESEVDLGTTFKIYFQHA